MVMTVAVLATVGTAAAAAAAAAAVVVVVAAAVAAAAAAAAAVEEEVEVSVVTVEVRMGPEAVPLGRVNVPDGNQGARTDADASGGSSGGGGGAVVGGDTSRDDAGAVACARFIPPVPITLFSKKLFPWAAVIPFVIDTDVGEAAGEGATLPIPPLLLLLLLGRRLRDKVRGRPPAEAPMAAAAA